MTLSASACSSFLYDAIGILTRTPEGREYARRAVNWATANFGHTALSRAVDLRSSETGPIEGRWFVSSFAAEELDNDTLQVTIGGFGYRGHVDAVNVTFDSLARIRYRTELSTSTHGVRVEFRPVGTADVDFRPKRIDGLLASVFEGVTASEGRRQMTDRLERGFTIWWDIESGMVLEMGTRGTNPPTKQPFDDRGHPVVMDDWIRLHEDGQGFFGPFALDQDERLSVSVRTIASWSVDAFLVDDDVGRHMLDEYVHTRPHASQPPRSFLTNNGKTPWSAEFRARHPTVVWIVLDNSDAGRAAPPRNMVDDVVDARLVVKRRARNW